MSVKYIDNMKNSRGVHARWAKLIGSYSFTISHAKVIVEDCVSRCPSHLPEPTQEELDMEKDWEADPPPQEWERPDEEDEDHQDWEGQLDSTITELHQKIEDEPGTWVHDWGWTKTTEQPLFQDNHIDNAEIFYSEDNDVEIFYSEDNDVEIFYSEDDDVEIFYSEDELVLGAVEDDNESGEDPDNPTEEERTPSKPIPRRLGRSWAPTQQALGSHGQQWDFRGAGHREASGTTQRHLPPERQPVQLEVELEDPTPADDQVVRAPTPEVGLSDLVLEPALDHKGRHLEPAAEGTGESDLLVLARYPATMIPATQLLIPGPRERAQAKDRDAVLSIIKDWVQKGAISGRLELDFGDTSLKAYAKIVPTTGHTRPSRLGYLGKNQHPRKCTFR